LDLDLDFDFAGEEREPKGEDIVFEPFFSTMPVTEENWGGGVLRAPNVSDAASPKIKYLPRRTSDLHRPRKKRPMNQPDRGRGVRNGARIRGGI